MAGSDVTTMSAYDLLPDEDRKAIAWVRDHGGLGAVEKRLMPDGMEWLLEVWPKWSNGEYCKFGDWWTAESYGGGRPRQLSRLSIYAPEYLADLGRGNGESYGYAWDFFRSRDVEYRPVKVEPPAPKVLDADGVEIRVGDVLYRKSDGHMVEVAEVYEKTFIDADDYVRPGDGFTHRAPVFAADVRPLREGEHVYHVETGAELVVKELPRPGEYQAVVVFAPPASHLTSFDPDQLTHERPVLDADGVPIHVGDTVWDTTRGKERTVKGLAKDKGEFCVMLHGFDPGYDYMRPTDLTHTKPEIDSWERIEEDAKLWPGEYAQGHPGWAEHDGRLSEFMALDLVRRCKALAERGE